MSSSCPKSCPVLAGTGCCGFKRPVQPGGEGQGPGWNMGEGSVPQTSGLRALGLWLVEQEAGAQEFRGTTTQLGI